MKALLVSLALVVLSLPACSKKDDSKPAAQPTNSASVGNPITAPVDYLGAVSRAKQSAGRVVDLASLKQAIQLFHASEDRFPRDLNELVQKQYIPRLPTPAAGTRLAYDPRNGAVQIVRQP